MCLFAIIHPSDSSTTPFGPTILMGAESFILPEFSNVEQMRRVIRMFEKKDDFMKIIEGADDDKVNIFIGNDGELVDNSAFVFKTIKVGGKAVGAIGVFGPSRMDYSKVISTVEYLSDSLSGDRVIGLLGEPTDND